MQATTGAGPARLAAVCLAAAAGASPCLADGVADGLRGSVAVTTDYVHRGVSQSDGRSAVQGSLTWWHPAGPYGGVWASSLRTANAYVYPAAATSNGADLELDVFAGYARPVGTDWMLDFKVSGYVYPDDPAPVSYDYVEFSMAASWRERWYATVSYTPQTTWIARSAGGRDRPAVDVGLAWQQPLGGWVSLMAGAGYHELQTSGRSGYVYGSTALSMQMHRWSVELGWYTTDSTGRWLFGDRRAGSRTSLTATVSF